MLYMKKSTLVLVWIGLLISVLIYSGFQTKFCFSEPGGLENLFCPVYVMLYVGGFLYVSALVAVLVGIIKTAQSKVIDSGEKVRQLIAKFLILLLLLLPAIYLLVFGDI